MPNLRVLAGIASAATVLAGLAVAGGGGPAGATATPEVTRLAGSLASFTSRTRAIGDLPASQRLTVQVWLRTRTAAATQLATAVATPGSGQFHRYLSPDAYAARFGATAAQASSVESWLRGAGLSGVGTDRERAYVQATGTATVIDRAFGVRMKRYQPSAGLSAGRYPLRSNDRPVSVPRSLAGVVSGVTGLDNASTAPQKTTAAASSSAPCSVFYGQHLASGPKEFGRTRFPTPICGYSALQLRAAYGATMASTGKGETVALTEEAPVDPDMFLGLQDWARVSGLPAPSRTRFEEKTVGKACSSGTVTRPGAISNSDANSPDVEEPMDIQAVYAMAPAASEIVVSGQACGGAGEVQAYLNAVQGVLDGTGKQPLASIVSDSWQTGPEPEPASLINEEHAQLLQAADEGVGIYFAAGDTPGVSTPASDPYAIAVGGTSLGIGQTRDRLFETGWSTAYLSQASGKWQLKGAYLMAGGGGPSDQWKQPAYQKGVVPAALSTSPDHTGAYRSDPDISADGDLLTAMGVGVFGTGAKHRFYLLSGGGTSEATPLVAGMVAAAQQGERTPFGFLNPVLYRLAGTSALRDLKPLTTSSHSLYRGELCGSPDCYGRQLAVFDDQSLPASDSYTGQVTQTGYDNMTGLGAPNGQLFVAALRAQEKRAREKKG